MTRAPIEPAFTGSKSLLSGRFAIVVFACFPARIYGCELCAIYSASSAQGNSSRGFLFTVAEQYVSAHALQFEGKPVVYPFYSDAFVDSSYTHLVPGYNFSARFGLSLNAPIIYRQFRRTEQLSSGDSVDERGTVAGLGDVALIARLGLFQRNKMKSSINISLLAGIKFPTGDTARLDDEVRSAKADPLFSLPNHQHGSTGGVHQHDLTLGSGSYDGVFGVTSNL